MEYCISYPESRPLEYRSYHRLSAHPSAQSRASIPRQDGTRSRRAQQCRLPRSPYDANAAPFRLRIVTHPHITLCAYFPLFSILLSVLLLDISEGFSNEISKLVPFRFETRISAPI